MGFSLPGYITCRYCTARRWNVKAQKRGALRTGSSMFANAAGAACACVLVEMGESRTPRPEPFGRDQLRACPMICRRTVGRPSAGYRTLQSRPLSGFALDYATLLQRASPPKDASTAHG